MKARQQEQFRDPLLSILSIRHPGDLNTVLRGSPLLSPLELITFPYLQPTEIKAISDKLQSGYTPLEALNSAGVQLFFSPSILHTLSIFAPTTEVETTIMSQYILLSYCAWTLLPVTKHSLDAVPILLQSLLFALETEFSNAASEAFIQVFVKYLRFGDFSTIRHLWPLIRTFMLSSNNHNTQKFALLTEIVNSVDSNDPSVDIDSFYRVTSETIRFHGSRFSGETAKALLKSLSSKFFSLNIAALGILREALCFADEGYAELTALLLAQAVSELHFPDITVPTEPNTRDYSIAPVPEDTEPFMDFPKIDTFVDGFDNATPPPFIDAPRLSELFPKETISKLLAVAAALSASPDAPVSFQTRTMELLKTSPTPVPLICALIFISLKIGKFSPGIETDYFRESLFDLSKALRSIVFDPRVLCTKGDDSYMVLASIRSALYKLICVAGSSALLDFLLFAASEPLFFCEAVSIAIARIKYTANLFSASPPLITFLARLFTYQQKVRLTGEQLMDPARAATLLLFTTLSSDQDLEKMMFETPCLTSVYVSLAFETELRPIICGKLLDYTTRADGPSRPLIGIALSNLLEAANPSLPSAKALALFADSLAVACSALSHRRALGESFLAVCYSAASALAKFDNSEQAELTLAATLSLFAAAAPEFVLDTNHLQSLSTAIKVIYGGNPKFSLVSQLSRVMSNDTSDGIRPNFVLAQPGVLRVMVEVFCRTENFPKVCKFVETLCLSSPENATAAHLAGVDEVFINEIPFLSLKIHSENGEGFEARDCALSALASISCFASSPAIVRRFVSLLSPDKGVIPDHFEPVLRVLNRIVASSSRTPDYLIREECKKNDVTLINGFSFACWLSASSGSRADILTVDWFEGIIMTVSVSGGNIVFEHKTRANKLLVKVPMPTSTNPWLFFGFEIEPEDRNLIISCQFDGESSVVHTLPTPIPEGKATVTIYPGNESVLLSSATLMEPVPLESLFLMCSISPRSTRFPSKVILRTMTESTSPRPSLATVLASDCKLITLAPLFYFTSHPHATELLSNALLVSETAEKEFAAGGGFAIIARALASNPKERLDYQAYNRFFTLLQLLKTEELQKQLFSEILTAPLLWADAIKPYQVRVVKHWAKVLFPSSKLMLPPFSEFLGGFMSLFKYSRYYTESRAYYREALGIIAASGLTHDDFDTLIETLFDADLALGLELAMMIEALAATKPSPIGAAVRDSVRLAKLRSIPREKDVEIGKIIVRAIISLHSSQEVTRPSLEYDMACLTREAPLGLTGSLPLDIWNAMRVGDSAVEELFSELQPSEKYCAEPSWALWPVIAASRAGAKNRGIIVAFLARCSPKEWRRIYATVLIVCRGDPIVRDDILRGILSRIACDLEAGMEGDIKEFLSLAKEFLFMQDFRSLEPIFNQLEAMYTQAQSPSYPGSPKKQKSQTLSGFSSPRQNIQSPRKNVSSPRKVRVETVEGIESEIFRTDFRNPPRTFGIRIADDGSWPDLSLALSTMTLFEREQPAEYFDSDIMLSIFAYRFRPRAVITHVNSLKFPPSSEKLLLPVLGFIMKRQDLNLPFAFKTPSPEAYMKGFQAFALTLTTSMESTTLSLFRHLHSLTLIESAADPFNPDIPSSNQAHALSTMQARVDRGNSLWKRLWNGVTSEGSPWASAVPERKWKRDSSGTFAHVPTKLRRCDSLYFSSPAPHTGGSVEIIKIDSTQSVYVSVDPSSVVINGPRTRRIRLEEISDALPRKIHHLPHGVEIFLKNGKTVLLDLHKDDRVFLNRLNSLRPPTDREPLASTTVKWVNRSISNYEYILRVNMTSGRTFRDVHQYPVFPWVLSDFQSANLKFTDHSIYRDFTTPIAQKVIEESQWYKFRKAQLPATAVKMLLSGLNEKSIADLYDISIKGQEGASELVPEIFSVPEILKGAAMPAWADSPIAFVYMMRKALESSYVSEALPYWLDMVFGSRQSGASAEVSGNTFPKELYESVWTEAVLSDTEKIETVKKEKIENGQIPVAVFRVPHPSRSSRPSIGSAATYSSGTTDAVFSDITFSPSGLTIFTLASDGKAQVLVNGNNYKTYTMGEIDPRAQFLPAGKSRVLSIAEKSTVYSMNEAPVNVALETLQCSFSDGEKLVVVGKNSVIYLYDTHNLSKPQETIPFYRDEATCCAYDPTFRVVIVASRSGDLLIHSIGSFESTRVVSIEGFVARKIVVTPSWGFIATYATKEGKNGTEHYMLLHTINGDLIRQVEIGFPVTQLVSWRSSSAFDFISIANTMGKVYVCEAFYLDFGKAVIKSNAPLIAIKYIPEKRCIVAVSKIGTVYEEPFNETGEE